MERTKIRFFVDWILASMIMSGITATASADEGYAQNGFYIGLSSVKNTIGGDFDGNTALTAPGVAVFVPKVERGSGYGITLGARFRAGALELSYLRSAHDVTILGAKSTADYNIVDFNFKGFFMPDKPLQPNVLFGFCITGLDVKNGSITTSSVGNAEYTGMGLNIGGGLSYYVHPRVSLNGEIIYRWVGYFSARGADGVDRAMQDTLGGSGLSYLVGVAYTF